MSSLHVRVESSVPDLPQRIASELTGLGIAASPVQRAVKSCTLQHRSVAPPPELTGLVERMRPFRLPMEHVPGLDAEAVLRIGDAEHQALSCWNVRICSDSAAFAAAVADACRAFGFTVVVPPKQPHFLLASGMKYGGAPEFVRTLLRWIIGRLGGDPPRQSKAWGDADKDIFLDLSAPATSALPLRQRLLVTVRSDTPAAFAAIAPRLREAGFPRIMPAPLSPSDDSPLRLDPGALQHLGAHVEIADITRAMADAAEKLGIDWSLYPLEMVDRSSETDAGVFIDMPVAAMRSGRLRPWSRLHPARYGITIFDDDRAAGAALERTLQEAGFRARRRRLSAITEGLVVRCGRSVPESLQERVRTLVDAAMLRLGAADVGLSCTACDGEKIEIELPSRAHREGKLLCELASAGRYAVKVIAHSAAVAKPLVDELKRWGFRSVHSEIDTDDDPPELVYGGARNELLDRIVAAVTSLYGPFSLARNKAWPMTDHDIYVRLPSSLAAPATKPKPGASAVTEPGHRLPAPLVRADLPLRGRFIEVTEAEVRIGDLALCRKRGSSHLRSVPFERFCGFCIDQQVAETLSFLALALRGKHPAALEGPTAASKTWSILYLASLLGVGVYRLNLSAQSDVSELVGRFIPDTERAGAFRWQHGPAPLAMIEGAWLVIDEADLTPTAILERCNPILETPEPQLHLSEFDGGLITGVHGDFRVLATWNGTSYAGREELSPAFLDRFKTRVCAAPTEGDYRVLGECLVHGRQPQVEVNGARYQGASNRPLLPELAKLVPDFDRFLTSFARFQAGLARMADQGELRARGRIAYTRRAFVDALTVMRDRLIASGESQPDQAAVIRAAWQALSLCHLERLDPNGERDKAVALLTACGIGVNAWELPR